MDISISINDKELHYIELVNRGLVEGAANGEWSNYTWRLYSYPGGQVPTDRGEIQHRRSDGALVLAAKILAVVAQGTEPRGGNDAPPAGDIGIT